MVEGDTPGEPADADVQVVPSLEMDPLFMEAVEDAVLGVDGSAGPGRILRSDPHDFAGLYIHHRTSFALHAGRFLNDKRDVEEVVQEAFLRLFLAMPELENELQAIRYCRRTVTNLCIDRYRADQRRPMLIDFDEHLHDTEDEDFRDPVLAAEDAAIVRQALALLSPTHRAALIKREIEEKPLPQIAAELGIAESAVKHVLLRARRALRRLLTGTTADPTIDLTEGRARPRAGLVRTARSVVVLLLLAGAGAGLHGLLGSSPGHPMPIAVDKPTLVLPAPAMSPPTQQPTPLQANQPSRHSQHPHQHHAHTPADVSAPTGHASPPASGPATSRTTPPKRPHRPATPPAQAPASSPAKPAFVLGGILKSTHAAVADQVRAHDPATGTYQSSSTFKANTASGTFALHQSVKFAYDQASNLVVQGLAVTSSVPTDTGNVAYSSTPNAATVAPAGSGYSVAFTAVATPTADAGSSPLKVAVQIQYAPDMLTVQSEVVTVSAAPASATTPPPSEPAVPPTSTAPSGTDSADPSELGQTGSVTVGPAS